MTNCDFPFAADAP